MFFQNINYVAVLVATIASLVVGFVWYSPKLFGKIWMDARGQTSESSKPRRETVIWTTTIISTFITAFIVAAYFNSIVATGITGIVCAAVLVWLGFTVRIKLNDTTFGRESWKAFFISTGYELVSLIIMSLIIALWR